MKKNIELNEKLIIEIESLIDKLDAERLASAIKDDVAWGLHANKN